MKPTIPSPTDSPPDRDRFDREVEAVTGFIETAHRIVVFTGAGVSAESGIPTYRGEGGYWTKYDPDKYASIDYFINDPSYYWRFFKEVRHDTMINAEPNPAHCAIAELERRGKVTAVVTQNIDGLHRVAGSKCVLELHGNTRKFYCFDCREPYTIENAWEILQSELPPKCRKCGGVLRPDVVLFGELLPEDVVSAAERASYECDLMLVVGSSLVVYPAANLPYQAKLNGAKLVIINMDPTPLDSVADLVIHSRAGELLEAAVF